jgi:hypothetical protein
MQVCDLMVRELAHLAGAGRLVKFALITFCAEGRDRTGDTWFFSRLGYDFSN